MPNIPLASRARLILAAVVVALVVMGIFIAVGSHGASAAAGCAPETHSATPIHQHNLTEFTMPHPQSDLMFPAVDPQGNIWFGEMNNNRLGRFNPTTDTFTEWHPAQGHSGIMGLAADAHGDIWYAELAGNNIGRFTPATCHFTIYAVPNKGGNGAGPNGLALAPDGRIWVTLESADRVAVLDPTTGALKMYDLPNPNPGHIILPYGIAVDKAGAVWFTELASNAIVRLDPATGKMTTYAVPTAQGEPDEIAIAPDGTPWFTELAGGKIGRVEVTTGAITEYAVPADHGPVPELYDILITPKGVVWITSSGANSLFSYDPASGDWGAITLPQSGSVPFGLALAPNGALWFTEGAVGANRIGVLAAK